MEESEEGEEDEEDEDDGEEEGEESESDYTSADEEIPEVVLPPTSEKLANRSLTSSASPILKEVLGRKTPSYSLPVRRAGAARASTGNY